MEEDYVKFIFIEDHEDIPKGAIFTIPNQFEEIRWFVTKHKGYIANYSKIEKRDDKINDILE